MRPLELLRRVTARVTGTYLGRLKSGELDPPTSLRLARQWVAAAPRVVIAVQSGGPDGLHHVGHSAILLRRATLVPSGGPNRGDGGPAPRAADGPDRAVAAGR